MLKDGKVRLVTGSPGGRTIPNTTLWVVLNVLEFGMTPREAVDAHRTHHPWFPDVLSLEGTSWPDTTREALTRMGHKLKVGGIQGDAHSIVVDAMGRSTAFPTFVAKHQRRPGIEAEGRVDARDFAGSFPYFQGWRRV